MKPKSQPAVAIPAVPSAQPLLIDIRGAAQTLGVSVFAIRNLCWNQPTARILKPVRHGLKFLFSPAALADFATKLVNGEIEFPATPSKPKSKKRAA